MELEEYESSEKMMQGLMHLLSIADIVVVIIGKSSELLQEPSLYRDTCSSMRCQQGPCQKLSAFWSPMLTDGLHAFLFSSCPVPSQSKTTITTTISHHLSQHRHIIQEQLISHHYQHLGGVIVSDDDGEGGHHEQPCGRHQKQ